MVVFTKELISQSLEQFLGAGPATSSELQERTDASLVCTSSSEPLNDTDVETSILGSADIDEGTLDCSKGLTAIGRPTGRVPVVSKSGTALMPCKPGKARKLLRTGKASKKRNKLGIFYIQLTFDPKEPAIQIPSLGEDPGSKFEGVSIVGTKDTVLNIMNETSHWIKEALMTRKDMRRARRFRKTRRRPCRNDNRLQNQRKQIPPPSTKARWDVKLRISDELHKIIPFTIIVVEDVAAETKKGKRCWNKQFSPLEVGKAYFVQQLEARGFIVIPKKGYETKALRERFHLHRTKDKASPTFDSHCVDSWVLAASVTGAKAPSTFDLYYLAPLQFHCRQLYRLKPRKNGSRPRYGGSLSLDLKRGTVVNHETLGISYIGGCTKKTYSLHSVIDGKRLTQSAHRKDFKILTYSRFRSYFISSSK